MESTAATVPPLPFDPTTLPRELNRHYIAASEEEIAEMLGALGLGSPRELFAHLPEAVTFAEPPSLPEELDYDALQEALLALAANNRRRPSLLGDGLPQYAVPDLVGYVSNLRNLTTAYTPYQPERSQGTLMTHWIYQCVMSQLTGFEAINSSLYDRATAIFEAMCTAVRLARQADTVLLPEALYPGDLEVVRTLVQDSVVVLETLPLDPATGRIDAAALDARAEALGPRLAAIVFPQVNALGLLEDVDALARLCRRRGTRSIAVIDPFLLASGGLKAPVDYGDDGVDMIVGEAQHLAIGPNFGGPGLGLFGVRHNERVKNDIRQTPGRYVGKARDGHGRECLVMVLSTREQHIRKDRATSNICSNQAFLATLAGAAILARGESGMASAIAAGRRRAEEAVARLTALPGLRLAYPDAPFFNEIVLATPRPPAELIAAARLAGLHLGVDVSDRVAGERALLKLSFSDLPIDLDAVESFFREALEDGEATAPAPAPAVPPALRREGAVGLPEFDEATLRAYYDGLAELNVSPDDACYPLGSCTMKYNPFINDWAAGLPGFTETHPQAPVEDVQGNLALLHEIQEWFKAITGLAGVTTQPVAGAQGELVGIKLFQAYHRDRGEGRRDVILIPGSAHGTNFATAVMAGYTSQRRTDGGPPGGIVLLEAGPDGQIDFADFESKCALYGERIAGVMITNPNTCGLFEARFAEIADRIHALGGLVYMDGANMNAICGWVDLGALGVDAVHNNLHKTWTIPHGGGGPGDAIVAVSERLLPFLPGYQIERTEEGFRPVKAPKSIGSFHRHWGNFAHKIRAYSYLLRLGREGVPRMAAIAVLAARYCHARLGRLYPSLPAGDAVAPRMHEFILTLEEDDFARLEAAGVPRALAITRVGKLFLDFGFHAPTVAWPETFGLMIEPTESYSRAELDRFCEAVGAIKRMVAEHPEVLTVVPLFTPVERIDDVAANRQLLLHEPLDALPPVHPNRLPPSEIAALPINALYARIVDEAHRVLSEKS
jgi:glycine dehydrogenase